MIWLPGGEFEHTGHVAVVIEVTDTEVRVAEQNFDDGTDRYTLEHV